MTEREAFDAMLSIVREHDLDALVVRVGASTYELVARTDASAVVTQAASEAQAAAPPLAPAAPPVPTAAANAKKVAAPIIGVFYRSPAPGVEAFVEVGDRVEVGQVLCILEAMKLMNEITSDYAGVVRRILPENGALVSLGEEMFWIEP
jgi:acetyl-CoA carboxylase biotin carboxyl carrier protein